MEGFHAAMMIARQFLFVVLLVSSVGSREQSRKGSDAGIYCTSNVRRVRKPRIVSEASISTNSTHDETETRNMAELLVQSDVS